MIIKSSAALQDDYQAISNLAHQAQEPIYITKDGEGDLVLMSIDAFEKREQLLKLRYKIDLAEKSRLTGEPGISLEGATLELAESYKNA